MYFTLVFFYMVNIHIIRNIQMTAYQCITMFIMSRLGSLPPPDTGSSHGIYVNVAEISENRKPLIITNS